MDQWRARILYDVDILGRIPAARILFVLIRRSCVMDGRFSLMVYGTDTGTGPIGCFLCGFDQPLPGRLRNTGASRKIVLVRNSLSPWRRCSGRRSLCRTWVRRTVDSRMTSPSPRAGRSAATRCIIYRFWPPRAANKSARLDDSQCQVSVAAGHHWCPLVVVRVGR
jgi:hypothetical protein